MLILTFRTDNEQAEIGLYDDQQQLACVPWHAHRELSDTIHIKVDELLKGQGKALHDVQGLVAYKGPGSFTGLRIGISVANALAYGLSVPIVGSEGDDWIEHGIIRLAEQVNEVSVLPEYGALPNITKPKH